MTLVLSSDGYFDAESSSESDSCCPRSLCEIDRQAIECSFINLLPSGPMWDRAKQMGIATAEQGIDPDDQCATMVDYAIYVGRITYDTLMTNLWPALRESNPATAVTTLDSWLDLYGWSSCFDTACRDPRLGALTPYEVPGGDCGPIFCPPEVSDDLECAVKRGIVLALRRVNMGGVRTLAWMNWVVEPLGAVVLPLYETQVIEGVEVECWKEDCRPRKFSLCHVEDETIEACPSDECTTVAPQRITAYVERDTCSMPQGAQAKVYPGVLAAECILLTLFTHTKEQTIVRCC